MPIIDGVKFEQPGLVIGLDLSLTSPGLAALYRPWGSERPRAVAKTLKRVPTGEQQRGLILAKAARDLVLEVTACAIREDEVVVVMEALLLQSGTGKAPERAAFWWMVRGELEACGYLVATVHPTTRRSLSHDDEARKMLAAAAAELKARTPHLTVAQIRTEKGRLSRLGKKVTLEAQRRRWPDLEIPNDDAADALVCADLGARALGWAGLHPLNNKNLSSAIKSLGIIEGE